MLLSFIALQTTYDNSINIEVKQTYRLITIHEVTIRSISHIEYTEIDITILHNSWLQSPADYLSGFSLRYSEVLVDLIKKYRVIGS